MAMHLGVGDAFIEQPGVQLVKILEPQTRREDPPIRRATALKLRTWTSMAIRYRD
jgi:hypothetical protein